MWIWDFVQGTIALPVSAGIGDEMDEDISSWPTKDVIFFYDVPTLGFNQRLHPKLLGPALDLRV